MILFKLTKLIFNQNIRCKWHYTWAYAAAQTVSLAFVLFEVVQNVALCV